MSSTRTSPLRPDTVTAHLFKCSAPSQYCLSLDRDGANIPPTVGGEGWSHVKDVVLQSGERRVPFDTDVALAELNQFGYYLVGGWYDAR